MEHDRVQGGHDGYGGHGRVGKVGMMGIGGMTGRTQVGISAGGGYLAGAHKRRR